jgi:hypothetical protein
MNHPEVESKLVAEVLRIMGPDTQPSYQQLSEMRYLNAVLKVRNSLVSFTDLLPGASTNLLLVQLLVTLGNIWVRGCQQLQVTISSCFLLQKTTSSTW